MTTRTLLTEAFFQELGRHGLSKVKVSHIIERAGISRGGFYHHYQNMTELVIDAFRLHAQRTVDCIHQSVTEGTVRGAVKEDMRRILEQVPANFIEYMLELRLSTHLFPGLKELVEKDFQIKRQLAVESLQMAARNGEIQMDLDLEYVAAQLYHGMFGVYFAHYTVDGTGRIIDKIMDFIDYFFDRLAPQSLAGSEHEVDVVSASATGGRDGLRSGRQTDFL